MKHSNIDILDHIIIYCSEITNTITRFGNSFTIFNKDTDYQRSISFCIVKISELANHLSKEFVVKTIEQVQWNQIISMRHKIIHNYSTVEMSEIWNSATKDIPELRNFCVNSLKNDLNKNS